MRSKGHKTIITLSLITIAIEETYPELLCKELIYIIELYQELR